MPPAVVAGRYEVRRELGRGGMATVYLAADTRHQRDVALKVLRPDLALLLGAERFLREIAITASLNHPHILPLLDSGEDAGVLFYVMPYIAGGSLRVPLRAGPLPLEAALRIVREVAAALDHAHGHGVIHRDIKPENILFSDGVAVVADFGIARVAPDPEGPRVTGTGLLAGTLGYMSPEQALGTSALDARSDTYSLGCVLYEMLVGATPAVWPGAEDVTLGRFPDLPAEHRERLDALPGRVEQVLVRALALRPVHRYATSGELAAALTAACADRPAFTDAQVRALLQRAATLQAEMPQPERTFTIGEVEQIAAQVGIPPVHVRRAVALAPAVAPPSPAVVAPPAARWDRIVISRRVPGEVPEAAFAGMVGEIQRRLEIVGHATVLGGTLTWSPASQGEEARRLVVQVSARAGQTDILIREDLEIQGLGRIVPAAGAMGGGLIGAAWSELFGIVDPGQLLLILPLAMLGVVAALGTHYWIRTTGRQPHLAQLADALAQLAQEEQPVPPAPAR